MSCEICVKNSCCRSFHSLAAQESFDSQPKDLNAANERIAELEAELMMRREQAEGLQNQWVKDTQKIVALEAEVKTLREALIYMRSGWRYIRAFHGDLYGVGWDRAQDKADAALAAGEGK